MVQSAAGPRSGGRPNPRGTLSEKRLSVPPSASRISRLEFQFDFATGVLCQSVRASSRSRGSLKKATICSRLRSSPGSDSSMRKLPQVSWVWTAWATVVSSRRRVRAVERPSTSRDSQSEARTRPANQASRRRERPGTTARATSPASRAALRPRSGSEELRPARTVAAAPRTPARTAWKTRPGTPESQPEGDGQAEEDGDQQYEQRELEGQPREVEIPAEKGEVGVENDPADDLAQGEEGACGESGGGDDDEDPGRNGRARPSVALPPARRTDGQAHGQSEGGQGRQKDVRRRPGQSLPRDESGHGRIEEADGLDPLQLTEGQGDETEPDENGGPRGPGEGVAAEAETGRRPEEGQGRESRREEKEEEDEAEILAPRRQPGGQGGRGQRDRGDDPAALVADREEERLDPVLGPRFADELVLVQGEEPVEAFDGFPEIVVADVGLGARGPVVWRGTP